MGETHNNSMSDVSFDPRVKVKLGIIGNKWNKWNKYKYRYITPYRVGH